MGSSPHTRDKLALAKLAPDKSGIIPAYAGQIFFFKVCKLPGRDHPRIRGTNAFKSAVLIQIAGSSPHTRDK